MKRQKTLLWTVLLCLFFVASNASVFTDAFIRDDPTYILNNVDVTEGTPFCELLLRGFPPHSPLGLYRPLTTLSFQWDYWVGGGAPLPFHITNVILHILSAGMLFGCLVQALRLKTRRAGITAVLFTLLPVQSEVIHSITARSESLAFLLGVGAVWAFLARRRFLWAALAPLLLLCSVLSKESGVMWCAVVAVLLVCSPEERRSRWTRTGIAVGTVALALFLRWLAVGGLTLPLAVTSFGPMSLVESIGLAIRLVAWDYPILILFPSSFALDLPVLFEPGSRTGWATLFGAAVICAATIWSIRAWRRQNRWVAIGFLAYLLLLLPYLHLLTPIGDTQAPRFFYASSALFCLGLLQIVGGLEQRRIFQQNTGLRLAAVGALTFLLLTNLNRPQWSSDAELWRSELRRHPGSPKALTYTALSEVPPSPKSIRQAMDKALQQWPHHPETLMRRVTFALENDNDTVLARKLLTRLRGVQPHMSGLLTLEAAVQLRLGRRTAAIALLREARRANHFDPVCRLQLAKDAEAQGRADEAEVLLREVIDILLAPTPEYAPQIPGVLGRLELLIGRGALSRAEFIDVVDYCLKELPSGATEDLIRKRFLKG